MSPGPTPRSSAAQREAAVAETRLRILDAAERVFSSEGFGGASVKAIAVQAGVAQGLIFYHYASKDGLYAAVIERRASRISHGRAALLDRIDLAAPDAVALIFEAFFRPPLGGHGGGTIFARIFATLAVGNARDQALVARHYDPVARRFVAALQEAAGTSRETAAWGYSFALGMLVGMVGRDGRVGRLAGDPDLGDDTDTLIARLTRHATGGFLALSAEQGADLSVEPSPDLRAEAGDPSG